MYFKHLSLLCLTIFLCLNSTLIAQEEGEENFTINELIGKSIPKNSDNPYKLRGEVYIAFRKMQQAALKDSIQIKIVSSYRSYDHQQRIWNRKFKRFKSHGMSDSLAVEKILEYSTIPGTSRHHWGTDIDIVMQTKMKVNNLLLTSNFQKNGPFYLLKKWMDINSEKYGFKLIYTDDPNRKGFSYEPWHYTYYPTGHKMLNAYEQNNCIDYINLENNLGHLTISKNKLLKYLKNNLLITKKD